MVGAGGHAHDGNSETGVTAARTCFPGCVLPWGQACHLLGRVTETRQIRLKDGRANSGISVRRLCVDACKIEFKEWCLLKRMEGIQEYIECVLHSLNIPEVPSLS